MDQVKKEVNSSKKDANQTEKNKNAVFFKKFFTRRKKTKIALTGILALAIIAFIWGKSFTAWAEVIIDSFTDTSKVADTWQVEVDTASGKIKLATRSCDSDTWICSASTTCSNTLGDGDYIIVASTTVASTKQWKTSQTYCDRPQCADASGTASNQLVADNTVSFSDYPARDACKAIGGRLPTITELSCIYDNQAVFNDNFGTGNHWSGTESSEPYARRVYFSDGTVTYNDKTTSNSVRCVRGW